MSEYPPPGPPFGPYSTGPGPGGHPPGGYGPPPPWPPAGGGWRAPRQRRTRGLIALAAATVVAAAAIVTALAMRPGGQDSHPESVVTAYLQALAAGDAQRALSFSVAQPSSLTLLSKDILAAQLRKLPITNIRVGGPTTTPAAARSDRAYISASADFGGKRSDSLVQVNRVGQSWKLASAFINIHDPGHAINAQMTHAFNTLQFFGTPIRASGTISVFPGAVTLSTSSRFIDVQQVPPYLLPPLQYGDQQRSWTPVFSLNQTGRRAVNAAFTEWITACYTPGTVIPGGSCSNIDPDREHIPGSAHLTAPVTLGSCLPQFDEYSMRVAVVCSSPDVQYTGQRPDGTVENKYFPVISTNVDISKDPPVVVPVP